MMSVFLEYPHHQLAWSPSPLSYSAVMYFNLFKLWHRYASHPLLSRDVQTVAEAFLAPFSSEIMHRAILFLIIKSNNQYVLQ